MKKLLCTLSFAALAAHAFAGQEAVPPTGLTIDVGAAALSGAGTVLHVGSAPVMIPGASAPVYYNADFDLQFLPDGRLAFVVDSAGVASGAASTPSSSSLNFLPGIYKRVENGCMWTLSQPGIDVSGARKYTLTKNDPSCAGNTTSVTWSTLPAKSGNPYVANPSYASSYPSDFAWGITDYFPYVRVAITGGTLVTATYDSQSGMPGTSPGTMTLVKQ